LKFVDQRYRTGCFQAYKSKMTSLEAIAGDATAGAVKKNKAANEVTAS
jgi:hypothetical protein